MYWCWVLREWVYVLCKWVSEWVMYVFVKHITDHFVSLIDAVVAVAVVVAAAAILFPLHFIISYKFLSCFYPRKYQPEPPAAAAIPLRCNAIYRKICVHTHTNTSTILSQTQFNAVCFSSFQSFHEAIYFSRAQSTFLVHSLNIFLLRLHRKLFVQWDNTQMPIQRASERTAAAATAAPCVPVTC